MEARAVGELKKITWAIRAAVVLPIRGPIQYIQ